MRQIPEALPRLSLAQMTGNGRAARREGRHATECLADRSDC